ncbi:transposase [Bacillus smithii]|jgi:hypothetical protein|uniref:transposase n=1 Tax=Bacillus smithii TaxID=1479 RepID=UPI003D1D00E1
MYKQYTTEFKLEVLLAYENRECTIQELCKRYQITKYSLRQRMKEFEEFGIEGLERSNAWKGYTKELKEDYLSGEFSQYEIVRKYGIRYVLGHSNHNHLVFKNVGSSYRTFKWRASTYS